MPKPFECASGSYTGTGAALDVTLGFKPNLLMIFDVTGGATLCVYIDGMDDDTDCVVTTAVALDAADGITLSATGFSLGTGGEANTLSSVYKYIAIGGN